MTGILKRSRQLSVLSIVFLRELVLSSIEVARQVLGDRSALAPAIIAVPVELRTRLGVTTLANFITLTPGTTSLHVSEDLSTIYVHALNAPNPDDVIDGIKQTFETRIKEIEG